jgi:hypothetical protein
MRRSYPSVALLNTSVALVPPKPKEFDRTVSIWRCRCASARSACREVPGRESVMLRALAMKVLVHHQQRIDRFLHAGRAERMAGQRLGRGEIGGTCRPRRTLSRIASISGGSPTGVEVACGLM